MSARSHAAADAEQIGVLVTTPTRTSPFVGRVDQLRTTRALLADAARGRTATLHVVGELGVGRSALLRRVREQARELGFAVAGTAATRLESDLRGGVLAGLCEKLAEPAPTPDAFHRLVRDTADRSPLLLAVDDLHVSDDWSLRCLAYLLRRLADRPLVVAFTTPTGRSPAGDVALPDLLAGRRTTVELTGLSATEVGELLPDRPADVVRACHEVTRGNPRLLAELTAVLDPGTTADGVRALGSPALGERLRLRLRATPDAPEVVRAAAVLGEDATADLVAALAGVNRPAAVAVVDSLVRQRLFLDTHPVAFAHPFLRAAVLADLPVAGRAVDHARAAALLAEAGAPDERVAEHLARARGVRLRWGVDVLRRVARRAAYAGRPAAARVFLTRALEERTTPDERLAVQLDLVHATFPVDQEAAMDLLRDALAHADDTRSAAGQVAATLLRLCGGPEARLALSLGLQLVSRLSPEEHDESWELRTLSYLAGVGNDVGPALRAWMSTAELESETPTAPRLRQLRSVLRALGHVLRGEDADQACRHAAEALAGERSDVFAQPFVFTVATSFLVDAPELSDRFRRVVGSDAEPNDYHLRKGTAVALAHGLEFAARGDLVRAKTFLKWQLRLFGELDAVERCPMAILCAAGLVDVLAMLGRFEEARELLARHGFAGVLPELFQHNAVLLARAGLKLATGDPAGALADAHECGRRLAASQMDGAAVLPWRTHAVRAHLALGQREAAAKLAAEELARARRWGTPRAVGVALISVGRTADDEAAITALRDAVDRLAGTPARLPHAEALVALGTRLRRSGDPGQAVPHLRLALGISARCEAKPLIRLAAEELRGCEPSTAQGTVHGLTKQETRVAGMAAQGLTNRQIAEALFLTRRTVELHLSGAYRKLGIAGRAALAEALRR
ncbi:LuxR C-terminal-related transcriptional regulator [Actinosynnema sp. NPDC020468]|uniref:LuxR C-terminal-related transcriptional regulator n=1 Tax=Actinosynnema sp. NPDC020468 TaxID=3154488 RepID=UPI0033EB1CDF